MTESRQVITIGTKLKIPENRFGPAKGQVVTVIGMTYYRGLRNESEHDLVLEVEFANGSRFSDVYYHFEPVAEGSRYCDNPKCPRRGSLAGWNICQFCQQATAVVGSGEEGIG